jgi:hypothetical protein
MSSRVAGVALIAFAAVAAAAPKPGEEKRDVPAEVHVVAVHEGDRPGRVRAGVGAAVVHVDRPGVEVTLVVSSYNPVAWEVTASPKTMVIKVILAGYHTQTAAVPKGAQVVDYFHEGRDSKPYLYLDCKVDSSRFRPGLQALYEVTRQQVRSFHGAPRFNPATPFTVNAIQDDRRLSTEYPSLSRAADVPKVAFRAVQLTPTDRHGVAASFGDFTQGGPDKGSLKPLPDRIFRLAYDPKGKKYYGVTSQEIRVVDMDKRTSTRLDPGPLDPRPSWLKAVTFDTKRDRLLVLSAHAIYEYAPATGRWGVVVTVPGGSGLTALAYHPKDDVLYALGQPFGDDGGQPVLHLLNAQGAVLKTSKLGEPMFPGAIGGRSPDGRAQLVVAGNHLAVLVGGSAPRGENGEALKAESFLFLIDPETAKVTLGWKE